MLTTSSSSGVVNGNTTQVLGLDKFCLEMEIVFGGGLLLPDVATDDHLELDRGPCARERRGRFVGADVAALGDSDPNAEFQRSFRRQDRLHNGVAVLHPRNQSPWLGRLLNFRYFFCLLIQRGRHG